MKQLKIMWTEEEWDKLAMSLHVAYPEKNFPDAVKLSIGTGPVMAVMRKTFDRDRWRVFHNGNDYKPKLLKSFAKLRPVLAEHTANLKAIKEAESPISSSVNPQADNDSQEGLLPGEIPGVFKARRVFWTAEEWLLVARELHRIIPQLLFSQTLIGVKGPDITLAQQVLPEHRRRTGTFIMAQVREALRPSIEVLRREKEAQEATRKAQEATEAEAARVAAINPYEAAMGPLMALLEERIWKRIQPFLSQLEPAKQAEAHALAFSGFTASEPPACKKPKVAIVGALPIQQASIAAEFPQVDFVMPQKESANLMSAVTGCDKVIGMVRFMGHPEDTKLRKRFGEDYCRVNGGVSDIKRAIAALLSSGSIRAATEASLRGNVA